MNCETSALAFGPQTADESVYFDPACGVGDLLLAAAGRLPLAPTAAETLALRGNRLAGCDLAPVFVRAAKARLALLAMRRRGHREQIAPEAVFRPPFVAIRRTSGPRDRSRAVATIVRGRRAVAVENHVIVCLPEDGSIERCRALLARLRSSRTDDWLNRRIRCRRLTTSAVAGVPWWEEP